MRPHPTRPRLVLPFVGLLAVAGALGACTDEKKGDPAKMTPPAPAADPTRPAGTPAHKPAEKP